MEESKGIMMDTSNIKGSCLCGKITYQYHGPIKVFQYCHCSRCRKFTGSAHASHIIIDPIQFEWLTGEALLGRYEVPDASHYATSFCKNCGSTLPWLSQSKKAMVIPAGTLDVDPEERPVQNIYMAYKAPWYKEVGELLQYEELPTK